METLRLYYNPLSPYCQKLRFFLEEASIPYDLVDVDFASFDFNGPEFLRISPAGLIPVVETSFGSVADSTVAMRYLSDRFQKHDFFPVNLEARAAVDFWIEYVNQHIGRYLMSLSWHRHWNVKRARTENIQAITDSLAGIEKYMPALERQLNGRNFVAGPQLTLADINLAAFLHQAGYARLSLASWPALAAWQQRIQARPAWRRVFAPE